MKHFHSFIVLAALTLAYTGTYSGNAYAQTTSSLGTGLGACKPPSNEGFWRRETKAQEAAEKLIRLARAKLPEYLNKTSRAQACNLAYSHYDPITAPIVGIDDLCSSGERYKVLFGGNALVTNVWRETRPGRKAYNEYRQLTSDVIGYYNADRERCKLGQ